MKKKLKAKKKVLKGYHEFVLENIKRIKVLVTLVHQLTVTNDIFLVSITYHSAFIFIQIHNI